MSGDSFYDDEAWDEERWEAFLRDNDKRVDRYMELFYRFMTKHPRPDRGDESAFAAWKETLRTFIAEKGWRREDIVLPFLWLDEDPSDEATDEREEIGLFFDGEADEDFFDEEDPFADDLDDFQSLPIYQHAFELSVYALDWAHGLSGEVKDSTLVHFCSHITQVPANIAKGHGLGTDRDGLGGNIACAKRGLADANAALDLLRQMKEASYMDTATYRHLSEHTFEVRNQLGVYIQELRARFNLGID